MIRKGAILLGVTAALSGCVAEQIFPDLVHWVYPEAEAVFEAHGCTVPWEVFDAKLDQFKYPDVAEDWLEQALERGDASLSVTYGDRIPMISLHRGVCGV